MGPWDRHRGSALTAHSDLRLTLGLALLLALAVAALTWGRVGRRRDVLTAALRAALQLTVIGLALRGVFAAPLTTLVVVALMLAAAVGTATRRLAELPSAGRAVLTSCVIGAGLPLAVVFAVGVLDPSTRNVIAFTGSVVGGTMTACTLTGRRLAEGLRQRRDEVEAWLALGATPRRACVDIARSSVSEALVPALDQTRTVGLVTLPGAFVGALFGGASPGQAARFQLIILVGLLAAESIAGVALAYLLGAPTRLPALAADRPLAGMNGRAGTQAAGGRSSRPRALRSWAADLRARRRSRRGSGP